jgi:hypothetical protein
MSQAKGKTKCATRRTRRSNAPGEEAEDNDRSVCWACKRRDPADGNEPLVEWVECQACSEWFHHVCVRYTPPGSTSAGNGSDSFHCPDCRRTLSFKKYVKEAIATQISELRAEMGELKAWTASEITSMSTQLTSISGDVVAHTSQIKNLASNGSDAVTRQRVTTIEDEAQRRDCLQVITLSGVPVFQDTNDIAIIVKIAELLQIRVDRNDIVRCWRAKVGNTGRVPLMYCRFVDVRSRNMFFHTWMKNKTITLDKIKPGGPQTKIYINEMLSTTAFKVMVKAKTLMKEKKITSAYSLDGHVLVKRLGATSGRRV